MKKYLILAAAAIVTMAACTKVETADDTPARKISFEVGSYSAKTKAHSLNSESITSFKCKAFLHGVGVNGTQDFFGANGETISYVSGSNTWEPSHDYYWPKSAESYVNFFSWYDTGNGPTSVTDGGMAWTNRTIAVGDNIMYADPAWHFQQNTTNAKNAGESDNITTGVPTVFHHALAKINIKAYATKTSVENLCTWTIALKNIIITSIYTSGTLTLSTSEPSVSSKNTVGSWTSPAWSTTGNTSTINPSNLASVTATTSGTAQSILSDQSVLPQSLASSNLTFDLDITTTYGTGNDAVTHQEIIPITIPMGTAAGFNTASWALNTIYTYVLRIDPSENKVLFDPAIAEEWAGPIEAEEAI